MITVLLYILYCLSCWFTLACCSPAMIQFIEIFSWVHSRSGLLPNIPGLICSEDIVPHVLWFVPIQYCIPRVSRREQQLTAKWHIIDSENIRKTTVQIKLDGGSYRGQGDGLEPREERMQPKKTCWDWLTFQNNNDLKHTAKTRLKWTRDKSVIVLEWPNKAHTGTQ